jgi:hypothetical protein
LENFQKEQNGLRSRELARFKVPGNQRYTSRSKVRERALRKLA